MRLLVSFFDNLRSASDYHHSHLRFFVASAKFGFSLVDGEIQVEKCVSTWISHLNEDQ